MFLVLYLWWKVDVKKTFSNSLNIWEGRLPDIMTILFIEEIIIVKGFLHSAGDENEKNGDAEDLAPLLSLYWSPRRDLQPNRDLKDGGTVDLKE